MHVGEGCMHNCVRGKVKVRANLVEVGVDGRTILTYIASKQWIAST